MKEWVDPSASDEELLQFYRSHLRERLLPFWSRSLDTERGGVYNCYDNFGKVLYSKNKYTWSQGRFLWLWSRMARMCATGLLDGNSSDYLEHAAKTAQFLDSHVFLANGACCYVLSDSGEKLEVQPGTGYELSIFADCFVMLGFNEYAAAASDRVMLDKAVRIYESIRQRLESPSVPSYPIEIPPGFRAHSYPMIMLNAAQELADTLELFGDGRSVEVRRQAAAYADELLGDFCDERHVIRELIPVEDASYYGTLVERHHNPGHAIEAMWFVLTEAVAQQRFDWLAPASAVIKQSFRLGWDTQYGGLFRFVDRDGGQPSGRLIGGKLENDIIQTWDMKIWWPHSEALYASLLCYHVTGDEELRHIYNQVHRYTFPLFTNPDRSIGEWINIHERTGKAVDKQVGLPLKDPYHIIRNVLLVIQLLEQRVNGGRAR